MKLTLVQRLMLYSLGQYYEVLNQPLVETPLRIQTSKITFIELLMNSQLLTKHERAIYKNLATLEDKKLIGYKNKMIKFTNDGLNELQKVKKEVHQFESIKNYFQQGIKSTRKLQTVLS